MAGGRIPIATAQGTLPGPTSSPHPDLVDFKAESLYRLGGAVSALGGAMQDRLDKSKAAANDLWYAKAKADTAIEWQQRSYNLQAAAGPDDEPGAFSENLMKEWDEFATDLYASAPDDVTRQNIQLWGESFRSGLGESGIKFDVESANKNNFDKFNTVMDSHIQFVFGSHVDDIDRAYSAATQEASRQIDEARAWMTPAQELAAQKKMIHSLQLARARKLWTNAPLRFLDELGAGPRSGGATRATRTKHAVGFFTHSEAAKSLSLQPWMIAGIVGTLDSESALKSGVYNAEGSGAFGVAQWLDRKPALRKFAASHPDNGNNGNPVDPGDINMQYRFVVHELKTTEGFALQKLLASTNVEEAVEAMMHFERTDNYERANPRKSDTWQDALNSARASMGLEPREGGDTAAEYAVDPSLYGALTLDEVEQGANIAKGFAENAHEDRVNNSLAMFATVGDDPNAIPLADFVNVHGEGEGQALYEDYVDNVQFALDQRSMLTMNPAARTALGESYRPDPGDPGNFKDNAERHADMVSAIAEDAKARKDETFAYSLAGNERLVDNWKQAGTPEGFINAIEATQRWQDQIGIDRRDQKVLSRDMVDRTMQAFLNGDSLASDRLNALASVVFASKSEPAQEAILRQLQDAGVDRTMMPALDAVERGDMHGAHLLARAALIKPEDLKFDLTQIDSNLTSQGIAGEIQSALFSDGEIGHAAWAPDLVDYGESADQLAANRKVLQNAVVLSLQSNGGDIDGAVARVRKAMFSDAVPFVSGNARLALKPGVDGDAVYQSLKTWNSDLRENVSDMIAGERRRPSTGVPASSTMAVADPEGLITPGNIDLTKRPKVFNADGSISTVRSMSFEQDGFEILIPTVSDDGKILSDEDAIALFAKTEKHLGVFKTADEADAYADALHDQQDAYYRGGATAAHVHDALMADETDDVLENGIWRNYKDGFAFWDTLRRAWVPNGAGEVLTVMPDDIDKVMQSLGEIERPAARVESSFGPVTDPTGAAGRGFMRLFGGE